MEIWVSLFGAVIVFIISVLILFGLYRLFKCKNENNTLLECSFYLLSLIIAVFYLVSYWFGAMVYPNLYSCFYQNECSVTEFEPFYDNKGIERYVLFKSDESLSSSSSKPDIYYWSDGQMVFLSTVVTKTHVYLSPEGRAYCEKNRLVIKNPWFRFITVSSYDDSMNIYLPEPDYREFQSKMCN